MFFKSRLFKMIRLGRIIAALIMLFLGSLILTGVDAALEYPVYYEDSTLVIQPEISTPVIQETLLPPGDLHEPKAVLEMEATAYTHTGNPTFTGVYPQVGTIAVDPQVIPLGTRMWVEGYGYGIAQDTGGLIKNHIIDVFMDTEDECWDWGRRQVTVHILETK